MANRHLEAFKEGFNVAGLATAFAATAALVFNPVPLLVALVAEAAYLAFVPDTRWYQDRLSRREDAAILERRKQLKARVFPAIEAEMRARFEHLERVRARLDGLSAPDRTEQRWHREILRELDFLLEKFLQFAAKEAGFRTYLQGVLDECGVTLTAPGLQPAPQPGATSLSPATLQGRKPHFSSVPPAPGLTQATVRGGALAGTLPPSSPHATPPSRNVGGTPLSREEWAREAARRIGLFYEREGERLRVGAAGEPDEQTRGVMGERVEMLERRGEFAAKLGRILFNLNHQMRLCEDTFGFIADSLVARPPEQVLSDIKDVVAQAETMTQVLDEVAPIEQMMQRLRA